MPRTIENAKGPLALLALVAAVGLAPGHAAARSGRPGPRPLPSISAATAPTTDPQQAHEVVLADDLLSRLNRLRADRGVEPLVVDTRLVASALRQATTMAEESRLFHQDLKDELDDGWSRVGENVGYGPDTGAVQNALVNSPGHYANLVERRYERVGIAVHIDSNGRLWVAQVFGG